MSSSDSEEARAAAKARRKKQVRRERAQRAREESLGDESGVAVSGVSDIASASDGASDVSAALDGASVSESVSESTSTAAKKRSLSELVRGLKSSNPKRREKSVWAIGNLGPKAKKAVPHLARLLEDPEETVRLRVAKALGKIGPGAAAAAPRLIRALEDGTKDRSRTDKSVAGTAARSLRKIGPGAIPALLTALEERPLRRRAARLLKAIAPDERPEISEAFQALLDEENTRASKAAVAALGEHGEKALGLLLLAVGDGDLEVSQHALEALREIGKPAVAALAEALQSPKTAVRAGSAAALASIALQVSQRAVARVAPQLADALLDEDAGVRLRVAEALGSLSDHGRRVLPSLVEALGDEDSRVSLQAVTGILGLDLEKQEVAARMSELVKGSRNTFTRVGACMVLMHLGKDAKGHVPQLVLALEDPAQEVREYAHLALQAIRTPSMRLQVIRTASLRLKVVDEEDEEPAPAPRLRAPAKKGRKRKRDKRVGAVRRPRRR